VPAASVKILFVPEKLDILRKSERRASGVRSGPAARTLALNELVGGD